MHNCLVERYSPPATHKLPLVLVPGMFAGGWVFEEFVAQAEKARYPTVNLSLRHHYGVIDRKALAQTSIRDYINDVAAVVRHIGECIVIGHSLGGLIAQAVASQCPEVNKAVFLAPAPPRMWVPLSWKLVVMNAIVLRPHYVLEMLKTGTFKMLKEDEKYLAFNGYPPDCLHYLDRFTWESGKVARELLWRIPVKEISCPSLVVSAAEDRTVPYFGDVIARHYGADHHSYGGLGHMIPFSYKAMQGVLHWLDS